MMRLGYTTDACMNADAIHEAEMQVASAMMLDVLRGKATAPRNLVWRAGNQAGRGWGKAIAGYRDKLAQEARLEALRTGGEPCPRCAARPGQCRHAPVKGGRLVAA